jgi:hypothetical protein
MLLTHDIITRYANLFKILLVVLPIVGAAGVVAGAIWALVLIVGVCVDGLRLLVATCQELSALVAGQPVLHFLFTLALACLVIRVGCWLVAGTIRGAKGALHV